MQNSLLNVITILAIWRDKNAVYVEKGFHKGKKTLNIKFEYVWNFPFCAE